MPKPDPRIFFAAERTLLAWVRTGITLIGLGFVIARFGLFLRYMSHQVSDVPASSGFSGMLGIVFVAAGALITLVATVQHKRYLATLPADALPPSYSTQFSVVVGFLLTMIGLVLAAYLAISQL